jgi:RNA polymerase-interacting CarD/CdnL/TRCF family regulator
MSTLKIGDRIALPQVGTGTVVGLGAVAAFGSDREFYQIRPDRQTSTIYIPTDLDPGERGLRRVMNAKQARRALEVLATSSPLLPDPEWRRTLRDRVRSGEIDDQAALVRDLNARMLHKRLSAQEKAYLEKATDALVEELTEALHQTPEEVRAAVDKAVSAGSVLQQVPTSSP